MADTLQQKTRFEPVGLTIHFYVLWNETDVFMFNIVFSARQQVQTGHVQCINLKPSTSD